MKILRTENNNFYKDLIKIQKLRSLKNFKNVDRLVKKINNSMGMFIGEFLTAVFGDYIIGTNHILPTSGSAKFSSGLGVLDFIKRSSIVEIDTSGYRLNQENVSKMA